MTKRVVFLAHSAADSGAERSLIAALAHWPTSHPRPLLILGEDGPSRHRAERAGVDVRILRVADTGRSLRRGGGVLNILAGLLALIRGSTHVARALRDSDAELVVAISIKSMVYGLLAGRLRRIKVVWSLQDRIVREYFPAMLVPLLRYVVPRLVDGMLVNSSSTLASVRPGATPVLVIHPGMELDPREFEGPREQIDTVVMLGRLAPWKGQDLFIRAFSEVFRDTNASAVIVGGALFGEENYERALLDLLVELDIADKVSFTGHVSDPWEHLARADVLVHCSRVPEPFGQVVVQGMWARCAVVASSPGGPAEVISHDVDGLLHSCGNHAELANALRRLRDESGLAQRLAGRARETAAAYRIDDVRSIRAEWLRIVAGPERPPARTDTGAPPMTGDEQLARDQR